MAVPIEYQKVLTEIVYINLPGPEEPTANMSGGDMLHGFLAEFARTTNEDVRAFVDSMCLKWNIHFRTTKK